MATPYEKTVVEYHLVAAKQLGLSLQIYRVGFGVNQIDLEGIGSWIGWLVRGASSHPPKPQKLFAILQNRSV
jgi:hypothetical protein